MATSFANSDAAHVLKIKESARSDLLVTRIDKFTTPINVINVYGKQECRTSKEEIDDDWQEIIEILA